MERLIITGVNGKIGEILKKALKDSYDIYGIDIRGSKKSKHFTVDISNFNELRKAFSKIGYAKYVIHLAADPHIDASWESVLKNNIVGTRNVYECSRLISVPKIIYASSNQVTAGYIDKAQLKSKKLIKVGDPLRPTSYYGVSKVFGEAIARLYYETHGINSIVLRIGTVKQDDDPTKSEGDMKSWLSHRDLVHLMQKSLESKVEFGIYYGVSNNDGRFWDISNAQTDLRYKPKDNSALFRKSKKKY